MSASHGNTTKSCATLLALALTILGGCPDNAIPPVTEDPTQGQPADDEPIQLQGARVEFPGNGIVASIVTDDGIGTTDLLGTDDGETITITGALLDIRQGSLQFEYDQAGRVVSLMFTSGALMTFTHHADGTFDYAFERNGVVEYTGTSLVPIDPGSLTSKQMLRAEGLDPGDILECADTIATFVPQDRCKKFLGVVQVPDESPIVDAFKYDSDLLEIALGACIFMRAIGDYFEEWEERACRGERSSSKACDWATDDTLDGVIAQVLGLSLALTALDNIATQFLQRATDPTAAQLCGVEEMPVEVLCDGTVAPPFADWGFENAYIGPPGSEFVSWAATSGQPILHQTNIDGQPANMPPGLKASGDYYLELPPGAGIAQTFATVPETGYRISWNIAVWNGPQPLVRTNVTYGVDADGNPVIKTEDQRESIAQDRTTNTVRLWGAECPTSTLEIVNLAEQSIFLDQVGVSTFQR